MGRLAGSVFDNSGGVLSRRDVTLINDLTTIAGTTTLKQAPFYLQGSRALLGEMALCGIQDGEFNQVEINAAPNESRTARHRLAPSNEKGTVSADGSPIQTHLPRCSTVVQRITDIHRRAEPIRDDQSQPGSGIATGRRGDQRGRPTWTRTLDGIISRTTPSVRNARDFVHQRRPEAVSEMTIVTAAQGPEVRRRATSRSGPPSGPNDSGATSSDSIVPTSSVQSFHERATYRPRCHRTSSGHVAAPHRNRTVLLRLTKRSDSGRCSQNTVIFPARRSARAVPVCRRDGQPAVQHSAAVRIPPIGVGRTTCRRWPGASTVNTSIREIRVRTPAHTPATGFLNAS